MADGAAQLKLALFRTTPHAGRGGPGWASAQAEHGHSASAVRWHWRVADGRILEARYEVRGCADLIAVTELAAVALEGQPAADPVLELRTLAARVAAPTEKLGRLFVVEDAMRAVAIQFGRG